MAERIKDTVAAVLAGLTAKKRGVNFIDPEAALKKALTKKELAHIRFNYFRHGLLGVSVDSSSWLYTLNLKKEKILQKLRPVLKEIKDIRMRIGEM